ncbi:MAG TPA: Gfo/Idh/MocA family oxidoreductase [Rhizomicrobium sp.]
MLHSITRQQTGTRSRLLRAAVVGTGAFGRHHASKYAKLPGVELVAVADPLAEARRDAAATHNTRAVADWRDLLGTVDLVSICSPAITHAPIVRSFLNAGAHVLVEKPIATRVEEADALIVLAEKNKLVLTVGHQERFVFARTGLLDFPDAPLEVSCWRAGPWTGRGADVSAVLDLMIHDLDLVHRMIPGVVVDVEATARTTQSKHPDDVKAVVTFDSGAVARLHASRVADNRSRGMRAVYKDGTVEFDFLTREIRNTTQRRLNPLEIGDPLGESVASFVSAVQNGTDTLVQPEEARRALQTALMIEDAAEAIAGFRHPAQYAAIA